jgi:hypothetical protein
MDFPWTVIMIKFALLSSSEKKKKKKGKGKRNGREEEKRLLLIQLAACAQTSLVKSSVEGGTAFLC